MLILRDDAKLLMQEAMIGYYKCLEQTKSGDQEVEKCQNNLKATLDEKHSSFKRIYDKGM